MARGTVSFGSQIGGMATRVFLIMTICTCDLPVTLLQRPSSIIVRKGLLIPTRPPNKAAVFPNMLNMTFFAVFAFVFASVQSTPLVHSGTQIGVTIQTKSFAYSFA